MQRNNSTSPVYINDIFFKEYFNYRLSSPNHLSVYTPCGAWRINVCWTEPGWARSLYMGFVLVGPLHWTGMMPDYLLIDSSSVLLNGYSPCCPCRLRPILARFLNASHNSPATGLLTRPVTGCPSGAASYSVTGSAYRRRCRADRISPTKCR